MTAIVPCPKPAPRTPKPRRPIRRSTRVRAQKAGALAAMKRGGRIRTTRPLGTKRREAKAAGYVDPDTWAAVVQFYRWSCAYCEKRVWQERDHVKPISKGGEDRIQNIVPACRRCNANKGQSTKWQPLRRHPWMDLAPSGPNAKCCEGCC